MGQKPQEDDVAMLSHQHRAFNNNKPRVITPRCYNCGKLGHITRNCRNKREVNANIVSRTSP